MKGWRSNRQRKNKDVEVDVAEKKMKEEKRSIFVKRDDL
jgi:hypothetical protein